MRLEDFSFELPEELIARYPVENRSASRLLYLLNNGCVKHHHFVNVVSFINPGDLLVFNDTKVIPARIYGHKKTGGQVEIFIERILNQQEVLAQVRVSKSLCLGDKIFCDQGHEFLVVSKQGHFYHLRVKHTVNILSVIEEIGQIPLPPYLGRKPDESDRVRYQTVYAKHKGSVAAPTAGFHFDEDLMTALQQKQVNLGYLTLHIGAGTFQPVRTQDIRNHCMHSEYFVINDILVQQIADAKANGKRVIAVGTTTLRALEAASQSQLSPYAGETNIFIFPGYHFKCVDALITNFHLPCSTLLMLVCAFGGYDVVMRAYQEAMQNKYRFYSYGDAMLLSRS